MSDRMTPIPFPALMDWILTERKAGSVFGVRRRFVPDMGKTLPLFHERLETPFGPAAGPHTQLSQNIIAAYYAGARFFELKTVQTLDGEDLPVAKPCILAEDECYNCEWSTELTVKQAFDEYVKAWFALKLLSKEFGWGDPDGFVFNMSVGYDFTGICSEKIDTFIEGLKWAKDSKVFTDCAAWAKASLSRFDVVDAAYIDGISPRVCDGITLSTLHGCPPQEIERIASYLISVKKLNTFVKCNPTLLGYDYARRTLDALGYDYIVFDEHHFNEDLQYADAKPMFTRLNRLAAENGVEFGLKLSNTFPVEVTRNELPSGEMYMSGRSLYPLTIEMARRVSRDFDGKLRLSFSGGADAFRIAGLFDAGVWPITLATTLLKPGGYQRLTQLANELYALPYKPFDGVSVGKVEILSEAARVDPRVKKPIKPPKPRKLDRKVPLTDCFLAPCSEGCPIHQDIPAYVKLVGEGKYAEALGVITEKNPLPFITGTICPHHCADKCTRAFYEESVRIRSVKLTAARRGFDELMDGLTTQKKRTDKRVAIVGGGPAGLAMASLLAKAGVASTVFEKRAEAGGIVRYVIPAFRIDPCSIRRDAALAEKLGAELRFNTEAPSATELLKDYTDVVYAVGAWKPGVLKLERGEAMNVIRFLEASKDGSLGDVGTDVIVVGGGNTAMDAARAAKRHKGVQNVRLVYRRNARYMPADEEELRLAMDEGVEFCELLAPVSLEEGKLLCSVMELGAPDASGRRSPVATGRSTTLPCSLLIAAIGERVDGKLLSDNGVALTERCLPAVDETLMTSRPHVYAIGDCRRGPATVVEGIADAQRAADAIAGERRYTLPSDAAAKREDCYEKQGILHDYDCAEGESKRCLSCPTVCECCVQVCPNRANVAIELQGEMPQIVHIDRMCNECGNCLVFCPYDSAPYKEKWTLFSTRKEFEGSENRGFFPLGGGRYLVRLDGVEQIDLAEGKFDEKLTKLLRCIETDYAYLLQ